MSTGAVVLNVKDSQRASAFWTQALDYEPSEEQPDFLLPRDGHGVRVHLDTGDRMHLDLWLDRDGPDLEAEVERLVAPRRDPGRVDLSPGRGLRGPGRHRGEPVLRDRLTP